MASRPSRKPTKPYATFPLTPHVRGGWAKKYKGHQLYMPSADPDEALADYHRRVTAIDRGQKPERVERIESPTVGYVVNRYARERRLDQEAGRLGLNSLHNYRNAGKEMAQFFGPTLPVEDLTPDHFTRFYRYLEGRPDPRDEHRRRELPLGAHALARMVRCCRSIWKYAAENDWIVKRPKYGSNFSIPLTGKRQSVGPSVDDVRTLVAGSAGQLHAMILLALNGGYIGGDCSALPRTAYDARLHIIRFPRPKMERRNPVDRIMTTWRITEEALARVIEDQRKKWPHEKRMFTTRHGKPWVETFTSDKGRLSGHNSVGLMYRRLCKLLEVEATDFSALRHVHRTLADELEKPHAAARIMGHRLPGLAEVYVDKIEHVRLQEITDHVWERLFVGWTMDWPRKDPARHEPAEGRTGRGGRRKTSPRPRDARSRSRAPGRAST
jgi:hypothetical protein